MLLSGFNLNKEMNEKIMIGIYLYMYNTAYAVIMIDHCFFFFGWNRMGKLKGTWCENPRREKRDFSRERRFHETCIYSKLSIDSHFKKF